MKNIIVFGASGDTGRYFVDYFLNNYKGTDYRIIATGTRDTDYFDKINVPYYKVDISKKEDFRDVFTLVDE